MLNRRLFLATAAAALSVGCSPGNQARLPARPRAGASASTDFVQMYSALPYERFPVPAVDISKIEPKFYRQLVDY